MKNKLRLDTGAILLLLLVCCAALAVPVALYAPQWLLAPVVVLAAAILLMVANRRRLRTFIAQNLGGNVFGGSKVQYSLTQLPIPVLLLSGHTVLWYNACFKEQVLAGRDSVMAPVSQLLPGLDLAVCARPHGQDITANGFRFTAYTSPSPTSNGASIVYLVDDTFYKDTLDEYTASRPACMIIVIDSYDELFTDMKDSEQAHEQEAINRLLEEYIGQTTGFLRRVSNSRYIAVVEERHIRRMIKHRFDILDKVRALHPGGMLTISIGVGHGGKTLAECQDMARESIDIALGRGGDQAAVKTLDGFEFFGGVSHGVEKRSHVRSRIIANALEDQIRQSDSVLIMGHSMSDLDAIGSAIGVLRICKMCGVPSVITVRRSATLAGQLIELFDKAGERRDDYVRLQHAADRRGHLPETPAGKPEDLRKMPAGGGHRPSPHGGGAYRQPHPALPRALRFQRQRAGLRTAAVYARPGQHHPAGGPGPFGRHHAGHPQLCAACGRADV